MCEPLLGLPLGLSQNVLDLWVVLETEQSRVSWGLLLCLPPSNPSPRPRPIPHSQSPQVIWSRRSRHSAKLSLSSPGSPHETQVWPAQCGQSDQDILSCFLWKHTPDTFLPALTSATRSPGAPLQAWFSLRTQVSPSLHNSVPTLQHSPAHVWQRPVRSITPCLGSISPPSLGRPPSVVSGYLIPPSVTDIRFCRKKRK